MKIDPRHLEIIAAIIDSGGLTEGAQSIGRAQPSVSRTVTMLEARTGLKLFEKNRRPLIPTELYLALAAEGRKIAAANAAASSIINTFKTGHRGVVKIGGTPVFMDGVISAMIAQFQSAFPNIGIEQSYAYTAELMNQLASGTLDLAICPIHANLLPPDYNFLPLMPGRNVIACGINHPLMQKASLRLSDIAPFSWVAPPASSPLYQDMRNILTEIGVTDIKISFSGGSLASIVNVLAHSEALTILPYSVVYMARRQRSLAALSIRISHPERSLGLLSLANAPDRPPVKRFKRFVEGEFRQLAHIIMQQEQNNVWRG